MTLPELADEYETPATDVHEIQPTLTHLPLIVDLTAEVRRRVRLSAAGLDRSEAT